MNDPSTPLTDSYRQRFGAITRIYGAQALPRLARAHFAVVGLGGVGSWVAEALARTGVGSLTLIELDGVCVSNTNRQLHTTADTIGASKLQVMAERLRAINPEITLHLQDTFLTKENTERLIGPEHHVVIDAIDSAFTKAHLVAYCSRKKLRLVCIGSSGGKTDPLKIVVSDLAQTVYDPLFRKMRSLLYGQYQFRKDRNKRFRVDAVYSTEQMLFPQADGSVCVGQKGGDGGIKLDCGSGLGSLVMVTGSFGFVAAAKAVERYFEDCARRES
ncbi:tRNA cyclic N6-threonylcarbamoyladenosine(37) synthase TcdA [Marinimicrobium alkaliphilum]|uniref:tRNA cyclic N6-threonylcarbamoyladenosine(37) synthase TcdA n=1 Tax=Marinimicrobium alkaliphilum TaxID=2202654 RepID=UPI000DBA92AF|nr:tRNA cyclic N6-threonylcarbamoyladenosine(37) synthase TcdA [Marinimicrobium alkaliphilum]